MKIPALEVVINYKGMNIPALEVVINYKAMNIPALEVVINYKAQADYRIIYQPMQSRLLHRYTPVLPV